MDFKEIDREHWSREEVFRLYTELWTPVTYSWMEKIDVTEVVALKNKGKIRFTPFVYYVITKALNEQENFRIAYRHNSLGIFSEICPLFPIPSSQDNITFRFVNEIKDYPTFLNAYEKEIAKVSDKALPDYLKRNFFVISSNPFSTPDSFSLTIHDPKHYFIPTVIYFKTEEKDGRIYLPVSINVNHATVDGKNTSKFFESLRRRFASPEKELS